MGQSATVQKRALRRSRLYLPATLQCGSGPGEAIVRDISKSGALLEASETPPVGSIVRLTCGGTTVEGRVAWIDSSWFGIEFSKPLRRSVLLDQAGPRLKVSAPRTYRRETVQDTDSGS